MMRKSSLGTCVLVVLLLMSVALTSNSPIGIMPELAQASSPPSASVVWNQTYGTANYEYANYMIQTVDGGYAIVGNTAPDLLSSSFDAWLVKTDANGNMEWNRTYGGTERDYGYCLIQTVDGGYAIVGNTNSSGTYDAWLVKTDSSGNLQWSKTYGGSGSDNAHCAIQTSDGGYVIGGSTSSFGAGGNDFWLINVDSSGNEQWNQTYGGASSDSLNSMVQTDDGGYALAGSTYSFGAGSGDIYLVKTDAGGNMQWAETYGGATSDTGYSVIQTVDGGYALAGSTGPFVSSDVCLVKTDSYGYLQWNQTYGGASIDVGFSVIQNSYGEYIVAGLTNSSGLGMGDAVLVKIDASGNVVLSRTYGGPDIDLCRSIVQTSDGGYVFGGATRSFGAGDLDFWLVKIAEVVPATWVVDDDGPADFSSIQQAIDAAESGDTILVSPGTYYENLVVNKALSLLGQDMSQTIIDGNFAGNVVNITASYVVVSGFTIRNSGTIYPNSAGVYISYLSSSIGCNISGNIISGNTEGIRFDGSGHHIVENNDIKNNGWGIVLSGSSNEVMRNNVTSNYHYGILIMWSENNVLRENQMVGNGENFYVSAFGSFGLINDVDTSNTVDGKPIYYWINKTSEVVPSDAGYVALINCTRITVQGLSFTNGQGIFVAYTNDSTIIGNTITGCSRGIETYFSSNNTISENGLYSNLYGISLISSNNNTVMKNNIIGNSYQGIYMSDSLGNRFLYNNLNNTDQAAIISYSGNASNLWTNNFWSDYNGTDANGDGIGDTPYVIDENNKDWYPLMGSFRSFEAGEWAGTEYEISVVSNSTVSNFQFNATEKTISFSVSGTSQTFGFSVITISNVIVQAMWQNNYTVIIDGQPCAFTNWTDAENTYIYVNYTHSEHELIIIPEFPSATLLPLLIILSMFVIVFARKTAQKKTQT